MIPLRIVEKIKRPRPQRGGAICLYKLNDGRWCTINELVSISKLKEKVIRNRMHRYGYDSFFVLYSEQVPRDKKEADLIVFKYTLSEKHNTDPQNITRSGRVLTDTTEIENNLFPDKKCGKKGTWRGLFAKRLFTKQRINERDEERNNKVLTEALRRFNRQKAKEGFLSLHQFQTIPGQENRYD